MPGDFGAGVSSPHPSLLVSGVESIAVYEEILRQVSYHINHGAALYERKFHLSCTEMNGRYSSNEFTVEVQDQYLHTEVLPHAWRGHGEWECIECAMDTGLSPVTLVFLQVNVLHNMNRAAHPSHILSSQQFVHRGHHLPAELSGHSLASTHNSPSM